MANRLGHWKVRIWYTLRRGVARYALRRGVALHRLVVAANVLVGPRGWVRVLVHPCGWSSHTCGGAQ
eukprot:3360159-Prymnesium_polylepis.2